MMARIAPMRTATGKAPRELPLQAGARDRVRVLKLAAAGVDRIEKDLRAGRGAVRIVAGEFRGRALGTPKGQSIRPTTDRTRESLFNILSHSYPESLAQTRMLDLFAGTGAVGFEAVSRGARAVTFVEQGIEGRGLIQTTIDAFGLHGRARVLRRDATRLGAAGTIAPFDLVFADPPYAKGLGERALASAVEGGWLAPGALVLLEEHVDIEPVRHPRLSHLETREFGDTKIWFFRYPADEHGDGNDH